MRNSLLKFWGYVLISVMGVGLILWRYHLPSRYFIPREVQMIYAVLLLIGVIIMAEIDMRTQEIPNAILLYFLSLGIIRMVTDWQNYLSYLVAFLLMGGLLLLIAVISGGKLGGGDIKLMALAGLCLGIRDVFIALAVAAVLASIVGLILIGLQKIDKNTPIPFGPFLGVGIFLAYLFGWRMG